MSSDRKGIVGVQQEKCFGREQRDTGAQREGECESIKDKEKVNQRASGVQRLAAGLAGRERLIQLDELGVGSLESWRVKEDKDISGINSAYLCVYQRINSNNDNRGFFSLVSVTVSLTEGC